MDTQRIDGSWAAPARDTTVELPPAEVIPGAVRLWIETGSYRVRPFEVTLAPGGALIVSF